MLQLSIIILLTYTIKMISVINQMNQIVASYQNGICGADVCYFCYIHVHCLMAVYSRAVCLIVSHFYSTSGYDFNYKLM